MLIKICGLTTPPAVQAAVDAGADMLGFVFADSPRRVGPAQAAALARALPAHVRCVAVLKRASRSRLDEIFAAFTPAMVQADAASLLELELPAGVEALPVFRDGEEQAARHASLLLYESAASGRGVRADWDAAARLAGERRLILAGGLDAGNVAAAARHVRPFGVDVSSGVEEAPGVKSAEKIAAFVAAARSAGAEPDRI